MQITVKKTQPQSTILCEALRMIRSIKLGLESLKLMWYKCVCCILKIMNEETLDYLIGLIP